MVEGLRRELAASNNRWSAEPEHARCIMTQLPTEHGRDIRAGAMGTKRADARWDVVVKHSYGPQQSRRGAALFTLPVAS